MPPVFWTKRTPLTKTNIDYMIGQDIQNYITLLGSPSAPIAFKSSDTSYDFTGGNGKWHVMKDLTIDKLQITDPGLYRVSAFIPAVSQVIGNIGGYFNDNYPLGVFEDGVPARDGWEVGLRLDGKSILGTQVYDQSGHTKPAFPEAYMGVRVPEIHTFEVVIRAYVGATSGYYSSTGSSIPANTQCRVMAGNPDTAEFQGTNIEFAGSSKASTGFKLTSYHMIQNLGYR